MIYLLKVSDDTGVNRELLLTPSAAVISSVSSIHPHHLLQLLLVNRYLVWSLIQVVFCEAEQCESDCQPERLPLLLRDAGQVCVVEIGSDERLARAEVMTDVGLMGRLSITLIETRSQIVVVGAVKKATIGTRCQDGYGAKLTRASTTPQALLLPTCSVLYA